MKDRSARFAQQSKVRASSSFKLALTFAVIGAGLFFFGHGAGLHPVLWVLAGFFLVVGMIELFSWKYNSQQSSRPEKKTSVEKDSNLMNSNFELVDCEGDTWRECKVSWNGASIKVRLLPESKPYTQSLPYANELIANLASVLSSLERFKDEQKKEYPDLADEIENLKLDSINFISKKEPDVAEVTFEEAPSGKVWNCAVRNGAFYNLVFDD